MNQIVDGVLKGVYEKVGQIDVNFQQIAAKHSQYDALVGRQQQHGKSGKGFSTDRMASTEVRGVIHDKDIKMPEFTSPRVLSNSDAGGRTWPSIARDSMRFPNCSFLFKKLRGWNDAVDEPLVVVTTLFKA